MKGLAYSPTSQGGFLIAYVAQCAAWVLLAILASTGDGSYTLRGVAWAHVLALGCFGTFAIALAMRALEGTSRFPKLVLGGALLLYLAGWLGLFVSFWTEATAWTIAGNVALALGVLGILVPLALEVFARATRETLRVWIVLGVALVALVVFTLALGIIAALAINGLVAPSTLQFLPAAHLHAAALLWLVVVLAAARLNGFEALKPGFHDFPGILRACAAGWLVIAVAIGLAAALGAHLELAYGLAILLGWMGNLTNAAAAQALAPATDLRDPSLRTAVLTYQIATLMIVLGTLFLNQTALLLAAPIGVFSAIVYGVRIAQFTPPSPAPVTFGL